MKHFSERRRHWPGAHAARLEPFEPRDPVYLGIWGELAQVSISWGGGAGPAREVYAVRLRHGETRRGEVGLLPLSLIRQNLRAGDLELCAYSSRRAGLPFGTVIIMRRELRRGHHAAARRRVSGTKSSTTIAQTLRA